MSLNKNSPLIVPKYSQYYIQDRRVANDEKILIMHINTYREANESLPAILASPEKSNAPLSPAHSVSSQMGSMATELEYKESSHKGYISSSSAAAEMTEWDYLFGGDYPKYTDEM